MYNKAADDTQITCHTTKVIIYTYAAKKLCDICIAKLNIKQMYCNITCERRI